MKNMFKKCDDTGNSYGKHAKINERFEYTNIMALRIANIIN